VGTGCHRGEVIVAIIRRRGYFPSEDERPLALRRRRLRHTFIDWLGSPIVHSAATKLGLVPLNLIVWAKSNAGMGSLYRSQHELLPLFKKGPRRTSTTSNWANAGAGARTSWTYPGASSLGSDARRDLKDRPTVKPTAVLEDALLDLSNRRDIVVDPFLGSHGRREDQSRLPGRRAGSMSM
jgi:DNA modification methylase